VKWGCKASQWLFSLQFHLVLSGRLFCDHPYSAAFRSTQVHPRSRCLFYYEHTYRYPSRSFTCPSQDGDGNGISFALVSVYGRLRMRLRRCIHPAFITDSFVDKWKPHWQPGDLSPQRIANVYDSKRHYYWEAKPLLNHRPLDQSLWSWGAHWTRQRVLQWTWLSGA
jgi:hypothetical protein